MLKRFLSFVLSAILAFGVVCLPGAAADTQTDSGITKQEGLMQTLGVVDSSAVNKTAMVTRSQFAEYIWRGLKLKELNNAEAIFTDVAADSHITDLATYGYFVGNNGTFEPEREMTIEEAYITAARVIGYDVLANLEGGTAAEYIKIANRTGLTDDVMESDGLTFSNAMIILYNALTTPVYEIQGIKDGGVIYSGEADANTLLEIVYGIKIVEGVVTANSYTSIYQNISETDENSIRIEQDVFECNLFNADKLLGRYVTAYYDDKSDAKKIVYVYTDDETDGLIELAAKDFISYSGNLLKYYHNGREKTASLESDAMFIHNGKAMIDPARAEKIETLTMDSGRIILLRSGKAAYYTVIINEFKTAVVNSVDEKNEVIYAENPDGTTVKFDKNEIDFLRIYTEDGKTELEISTLERGNLISYILADNNEFAEIYLCKGSVSGEVSALFDADGEKIVEINEKRYSVNKEFDAVAELKVGISTTYLLDIFGNIAYEVEGKGAGNKNIAYIYDITKSVKPFGTDVLIKVFASDGKHKELTLAEKCKIDEIEDKTPTEIFDVLAHSNGKAVRQLIMYTLDNEGCVNEIDTAAASEAERESENTLWVMAPKAEREYLGDKNSEVYIYTALTTDSDPLGYPLNTNTTIIYAPETDVDITSENIDLFRIGALTGIGLQDVDAVSIYKYNDLSPYADVIVMGRDEAISSLSSATYLINDITRRLTNDGKDEVTAIMTLPDTAETSRKEILIFDYVNIQFNGGSWLKVAAEDVDKYLSPGDIVQVGNMLKNENGEQFYRYMRLTYDYSEDKTFWATASEPHKYGKTYEEWREDTEGNGLRYTFGYVDSVYIEQDMLDRTQVKSIFAVSDYEHNVMDMFARDTARNRFPIFDGDRLEYENAYSGVVGDIVDYQSGKENASRVFLRWDGTGPRGYIFYK